MNFHNFDDLLLLGFIMRKFNVTYKTIKQKQL